MEPVRLCETTLKQEDDGVAPIVQVQFLSQVKDAVNAAPYGMHTSPVLNTPCLLITINNDSANSYVLPLSFIERKNESELKEGEVIIGNFTKQASILFDEDGNINIATQQNLNATVEKQATVEVKGDLKATVEGNADIDITGTTDLDSTGNITVDGPNITVNSPGTINVTGSSVVLGSNTTIDSKVFLNHIHSGVTPGVGNTGPVV